MASACNEEHTHNCNHLTSSAVQSLEEMDFERGIWNAAIEGNTSRIKKFLNEDNISPNLTDNYGYTALHYACRHNKLEAVTLLLQSGANTNIQSKTGRVTALHRAAYCGYDTIIRILMSHGADTSLKDADGQTALHKACQNSKLETAKLLLQSSSSSVLQVRDGKGHTPVELMKDTVAVAELLSICT